MITHLRPLLTAILAAIVALAVIIGLLFSDENLDGRLPAGASQCQASAATITPRTGTAPGAGQSTALSAEQIANAHLIATVIRERLPAPQAHAATAIALMVAMAESSLRNLDHGDRDSLGLFQQRAGWGSATQRRDVRYATAAFLGGPAPPANPGLTDLPNWQYLPPWAAAQAVQRSAYPDGSNYRRWAPMATALATHLLSIEPPSPACATPPPAPTDRGGPSSDSTVPAPVRTAITWALKALGTPYQWGGHCEAPKIKPVNPIRDNCDCSSLLQVAYRTGGIAIPRTTYDQVHAGRPVPISQVAPGDLVFTPGSGGSATAPGHVAMYIGDNTIIQAPRTNDVVKLTDWALHKPSVVAVRRIVN
ncbi:C40 family peptidase [Streptosporangium sp. CA-115845]|uniref:C40 family peptidase n=1 Tax=Streptosporangium sp. CA-115845 TaxID=3240071 RepID=UPI003D8C99FB